ncbi:MAG TPA: hypothetical protein VFQ85_06430 [Mycobacteriales bacterium]|jgi:hypothetical protein|nr:hypothetical protein [Mycobacteriales bacterium]
MDPFLPPDTEASGRRVVGVVAWAGLAVGVAAFVLTLVSHRTPGTLARDAVTDAVALAVAVGCLRHGARHEHERGRAAAIATVVLALVTLTMVAAAVYVRLREG